MRKFLLIAVLALALVSCVGLTACTTEDIEHTITFTPVEGLTFQFQGQDGNTVTTTLSEIYFTLLVDEGYAADSVVVKVNGNTVPTEKIQFGDNYVTVTIDVTEDATVTATVDEGSYELTLNMSDEDYELITVYKPGTTTVWENKTSVGGFSYKQVVKFEAKANSDDVRIDQDFGSVKCISLSYYEDASVKTPTTAGNYVFAIEGERDTDIYMNINSDPVVTLPLQTSLAYVLIGTTQDMAYPLNEALTNSYRKYSFEKNSDAYFPVLSDYKTVDEVNAFKVYCVSGGQSVEATRVGANSKGYDVFKIESISADTEIVVLNADETPIAPASADEYTVPNFILADGVTKAYIVQSSSFSVMSGFPYAYVNGVAVLPRNVANFTVRAYADLLYKDLDVVCVDTDMIRLSFNEYMDTYRDDYNFEAVLMKDGIAPAYGATLDINVNLGTSKKSTKVVLPISAENLEIYAKSGNVTEWVKITTENNSADLLSDTPIYIKVIDTTATDIPNIYLDNATRISDSSNPLKYKTDDDFAAYFVVDNRYYIAEDGLFYVTLQQ